MAGYSQNKLFHHCLALSCFFCPTTVLCHLAWICLFLLSGRGLLGSTVPGVVPAAKKASFLLRIAACGPDLRMSVCDNLPLENLPHTLSFHFSFPERHRVCALLEASWGGHPEQPRSFEEGVMEWASGQGCPVCRVFFLPQL